MMAVVMISIVLAVLGVAVAMKDGKGLPESISAMVYDLARYGKWAWTVWVAAVTMTACVPLLEVMPGEWQFLAFLTMACLVFVAFMPLVVTDSRRWHYILAIAGGILSQVCVAVVSPWWLLAWFMYIPLTAGLWRWADGKSVFFMEVLAMTAVYGALATSLQM